jgi:hypothetical protein
VGWAPARRARVGSGHVPAYNAGEESAGQNQSKRSVG